MDKQTALVWVKKELGILTPEQYDDYLSTVRAMEHLRLNSLASLTSTDDLASEITAFLAARQRPPQIQRLLEAQSEALLLVHIAELEKFRREKAELITKSSLHPPAPEVRIIREVAPAPEPKEENDYPKKIFLTICFVLFYIVLVNAVNLKQTATFTLCLIPVGIIFIIALASIWLAASHRDSKE